MGRPKKNPRKFYQGCTSQYPKNLHCRIEILIVMQALRAENSIAEICRKHSINLIQIYRNFY